jgi:hypothetical protein
MRTRQPHQVSAASYRGGIRRATECCFVSSLTSIRTTCSSIITWMMTHHLDDENLQVEVQLAGSLTTDISRGVRGANAVTALLRPQPWTDTFSGIVALTRGTRVNIYKMYAGGGMGMDEVILQPGEVIFFPGNLLHAGSSFGEANVRIHFYDSLPESMQPQKFHYPDVDGEEPKGVQHVVYGRENLKVHVRGFVHDFLKNLPQQQGKRGRA